MKTNLFHTNDLKSLSSFNALTSKKNKSGAIILNSGDSNGYGIVLNLGRENIPVLSIDSKRRNITFLSRYAQKLICPDYKIYEEKFITFLLAVGSECKLKPVMFVSGDRQLLCVLRHRKRLEPYFHLPMAPIEIVETLVDKIQFYDTLQKFGIPHAKTNVPENEAEVRKISQELDYPCILKPVQSTSFVAKFGNKCLKARSAEELVEVYRKVSCEEDDIIIQKELIGTERYLVNMYFDKESHLKAACCYQKLRIQPIDFGNASSCFTMWEPGAVDIAVQCLKSIGYTGFAEAEIQRDHSDGKLKLVEINARSTTQTRLSARCGMNMEYMAYKEILGEKINWIEPSKIKVIWIDIIRDILSVFSFDGYLVKKKVSLGEVIRSVKGRREYAYLAWDDPKPFLSLLFTFIRTSVFRKKNFWTALEIMKSSK